MVFGKGFSVLEGGFCVVIRGVREEWTNRNLECKIQNVKLILIFAL